MSLPEKTETERFSLLIEPNWQGQKSNSPNTA